MAQADAAELLLQYARYHRDPRNIATHFVGIPLIVFSVCVLLGRLDLSLLGVDAPGVPVNGGWVAFALVAWWYLRRGLWPLALATVAVIGVLGALAQPLVGAPTGTWLAWGLGSFVVGWALQFIGHFWEGRKPAFVDDLRGLLVGPMFVVAEVMFALGWGAEVHARIEQQAGPVRRRESVQAV
jgi:uncharacterized membrane protein YGL010W